jgi:hypothetical protein
MWLSGRELVVPENVVLFCGGCTDQNSSGVYGRVLVVGISAFLVRDC